MSSHLAIHPDLKAKTWYSILPNSLLRVTFRQLGKQHFLIVRDPFTRLESFYKSKILAVNNYTSLPRGWQHCQQLILKQLGISPECELETGRQAFTKLSFSSFIELLPEVYKKDGHLTPQRDKIYVSNMYDKVLKLEVPEDLTFLQEKLGIDTGKKTGNSDRHITSPIEWDDKDITIVTKLYKDDFKLFDYEIFPRSRK